MGYWGTGFDQAWQLIINHDQLLWDAIDNTLEVALVATAIATVLGVPLGLLLGLGRFRGRNLALSLANVGLSLPPVVIGTIVLLLLLPGEPLGPLGWVFTLKGVMLAQTVLAFPVVVSLTAAAVNNITEGLLDQARGFEARLWRVWTLAVREARIGIVAAIIAAMGTALSEVAAVVIVGGNVQYVDQTLGSLALFEVNAGMYATALADGIVLLVLILILSIALTTLQYVGRRPPKRGRR